MGGGGGGDEVRAVDEVGGGGRGGGRAYSMGGGVFSTGGGAGGIPVEEGGPPADTVMFCLSKGLGAPIGSILAGPADLMEKGRLYRKRLGGGMRQAGVIAAAGLVAMAETPPKLATDHANARALAEGLSRIPGVQV